jgi:hypothetical protein
VPYEWQQYVRHLLQIVQMNVGTAPPQPLDRLSALLRRFEVRAGVFRTGIICGVAENDGQDPSGRLHILRGGRLRVTGGDAPPIDLTEPSVLFFPRGLPHRLDTGGPEREAEILCARIDLGGATSPLVAALPEVIALPLAASDGMRATLEVLVEEAFTMNCGRQAVLDRLCEVVVVKLLRHVIGRGEARFGMLAGLSHPTLRHALTAIHESPERPWTLERLADAAGMSRTAFANTFRDVVGGRADEGSGPRRGLCQPSGAVARVWAAVCPIRTEKFWPLPRLTYKAAPLRQLSFKPSSSNCDPIRSRTRGEKTIASLKRLTDMSG